MFLRVFVPRAWRKNQKIQYKINREQYRDLWQDKRDQRADVAARRHDRVTRDLAGQGRHDFPWWREPSLASLIGRRNAAPPPPPEGQ